MPVKNEESLARMLGASFSEYANRVQNGLIQPYRKLLEQDNITVFLTVRDNGEIIIQTVDSPMVIQSVSEGKPTHSMEMVTQPVEQIVESPVLEAKDQVIGLDDEPIQGDPIMAEPYNTKAEMDAFIAKKKEPFLEEIVKPKSRKRKTYPKSEVKGLT